MHFKQTTPANTGLSTIMKDSSNNKIEAIGNKLGGFSKAGCPCASFNSFYIII